MTALSSRKRRQDKEATSPPGRSSGRGVRILYQFLLVTLAVSVIPLLMASYKLLGINQAYLEDELLALHSQVANSAAEEISTAMTTILGNLELVAARAEARVLEVRRSRRAVVRRARRRRRQRAIATRRSVALPAPHMTRRADQTVLLQ